MCILIVAFHKLAINHMSHSLNSVDFLGISANHNLGSLRSLHFKICQIFPNSAVYHVMMDFRVSNYWFCYDTLQILSILAISLKQDIILSKFLETLLLFLRVHTFVVKTKIHLKLFKFKLSDFLFKTLCHPNVLKIHLETQHAYNHGYNIWN